MMLEKSAALWNRADHVLAAGPATFSKHPQRFAANVTPCALVSGEGCYVTDVDGNTYLDTIGALGPMILGYGNDQVDTAVMRQIRQGGGAFSLMHPLEVDVAEQLVAMIPCADQVRFCLNGSDATNAAVRLAREITGKPHLFFCGYHGFMDSYICTTSMNAGTLPCLQEWNHQYAWGDWATLDRDMDEYHEQGRGGVAALMLEVPPRPWGESPDVMIRQLRELQELCEVYNTLFILDEVVTGFRYHLGSAQAAYGIIPDLACIGKAMANGYPLAALVGRIQHMEQIAYGGVFMSSTNGGNALSLAAAQATLHVLQTTTALDDLHRAGNAIGNGLNALFLGYELPVRLLGNASRMIVQWQSLPNLPATALKTLWMQEMILECVLVGGPLFPQACMTSTDVTTILAAADAACDIISHAVKAESVVPFLHGHVVESDVFANRYR